jgi:hypothetical protein
MNRAQLRRAACKIREGELQNYIHHLPEVPVDAPMERGKVYHYVFHHDPWCTVYDGGGECNCNVEITKHADLMRPKECVDCECLYADLNEYLVYRRRKVQP